MGSVNLQREIRALRSTALLIAMHLALGRKGSPTKRKCRRILSTCHDEDDYLYIETTILQTRSVHLIFVKHSVTDKVEADFET